MSKCLELLIGLLNEDSPGWLAWDDFTGPCGAAVRLWQQMGFLKREPAAHPSPTCPYCDEGVPYRTFDGRYRCNSCMGDVDSRHLQVWEFDREAFLRWLAREWDLRGEVQRIGDRLWQLGSTREQESTVHCFYQRPGPLTDVETQRLRAFAQILVVHGLSLPAEGGFASARHVCLLELLRAEDGLGVAGLEAHLRTGQAEAVRFDAESGVLWAGGRRLGEVPVSSKEFFFLDCLARDIDAFVGYADIKRHVLWRSNSTDGRDEATFCQRLKSRIKKKFIPQIDRVIATTNKADGYRLRGRVEL